MNPAIMSPVRETTKIVTLFETDYQVCKMTPRTACWIAMQILTKVLPQGLDSQLLPHGVSPQLASQAQKRSEMSEQEFYNIQDHCLACCSKPMDVGGKTVYQPVVRADGRFNDPDLETNFVAVLGLTLHALQFNVAPFFQEDALRQLLGSFSETDLSSLFPASK